ncbi:hypothetical protein T459_29890 [Capsicum annuum]|uniref:F-box domain-containing protein n=1 Tax=Capsicum annuum TaxID=4072 RepID=A0A2G2Y6S8_CAPAN|nr:hypothetical protein T459_29890 [Capsicum annuum]
MKRRGSKRTNKVIKENFCSSIESLPNELLTDIVARVASRSFKNFINVKLSCKVFDELANERYVYQKATLVDFPIAPWEKQTQEKISKVNSFMELCRECENTEALYRKGVLDYFKDDEAEVALEFLKRAENGGHVGACFGTKTTHWLQHQQRSRKNVWSSDTEDEDDGHADFHCNACSCDVEIAHIWQSDALDFTTYRSSAYLSPQASGENLLIGANFATAGAGYDDKPSILNHAIPLPKQMQYYKEYQSKLAKGCTQHIKCWN